jgi:pyrophosphatase PpaX
MAMPAPAPPSGVRRPPTLLFDLDGTLLDSIELILNSARYCFEKLGRVAPSDEEWSAGIGIPLFTMLGRYSEDEADLALLLAAYREYQVAHHDRLTRCYDGVADAIREFHEQGHDLAIVTSKSEALAMRGLVHVGLARYIDTIVGCDASARHKPDPEPVRIALHRLACDPRDAIFIGDSVHDILSGNAAGVRTVAALWGAGRRDEMALGSPTHYATTIFEVKQLVDCWDE